MLIGVKNSMFNKKSILITGGTGSFGYRYVSTILERYDVNRLVIYSRDELKQYEMHKYFADYEDVMRFFIGDVRDLERLKEAMRGIDIVIHAVEFKKKHNLSVTLGIQMVLMPEFKDEIIPFAKLGVDLGVDYAVIKHCSDDEYHTLGVDYSKYEQMYELLEQAESLSTEKTKVIVKWDKINDKGKPSYNRFYGPPFLLQISGSGLVAPSGMFFNARYSKLHIGDFTTERFIDMWNSDKYWRAMNYLASPAFDAQTMMGTLPIQHYISVALDNHVKGVKRIKNPKVEKPMHVNFL